MHRALADIESIPELKARHLALATLGSDPATLQALDDAADAAGTRGAPAAAAEFVDLAIGLGGDTPERLIRAAAHHFRAGNAEPARAVIEPMVGHLPPGPLRATAANLLAEVRMYDNSFATLSNFYETGKTAPTPRCWCRTFSEVVCSGQYRGVRDESLHYAQRAATLAEELDLPALTSQARAMG